MRIQMTLMMILIQGDSRLILYLISEKIYALKDIINLTEDIRLLPSFSRDTKVEYCNMLTNRNNDGKKTHLNKII